VLTSILENIKPEKPKPEDETYELIRVSPGDLGGIALFAFDQLKKPNILLISHAVKDYSNDGPLNHEALSKAQDFEIPNGHEPVMGFHSSPVTPAPAGCVRPRQSR
jgi:hypothetical protein